MCAFVCVRYRHLREKEPHRDCPVVCPGSAQSPGSMFLYTQALELALPLHVVWLQASNFSKRSHISKTRRVYNRFTNTPNTPSEWHNFIKTCFSYWLMFLPLPPPYGLGGLWIQKPPKYWGWQACAAMPDQFLSIKLHSHSWALSLRVTYFA